MEQDVGLVILKHLRHQLDVHVLNVDLLLLQWINPGSYAYVIESLGSYLEALVHHDDGLIKFLLQNCEVWGSWLVVGLEYEIDPLTTLVMIRDKRRFCWCSCGLSYK
jgi:hypothetical protein